MLLYSERSQQIIKIVKFFKVIFFFFIMSKFHKVTVKTVSEVKSAGTAKLTILYKKLKLKQQIAAQNAWFNQQCKKLKVVPSYICVKVSGKCAAAVKARKKAEETWLLTEIKKWFTVRDNVSVYLKLVHSCLTSVLHPVEFDVLDDQIRTSISEIMQKRRDTQASKLARLQQKKPHTPPENQQFSEHQFFKRVENLSDTQFSEEELALLNKGLKYCPGGKHQNTVRELAIDAELALRNNIAGKHKVAEILQEEVRKTCIPRNAELATLAKVQTTLRDEQLVLSKSDKGTTTVIMSRTDYEEKVREFLNEDDFKLLDEDPTPQFQKKVKTNIEDCKGIFCQNVSYSVMNPVPPRLYGLPKIHKPNIPIRPVVSYINAPCYLMSKHLNSEFRKLTSFKPKHSLLNSSDLISKIQNTHIPHNAKLVSFDVTSLFTSVPVSATLELTDNFLSRSKVNPVLAFEFMKSFRTCISQNYFKYDDQYYLQKDGLPMGSPLSPLFADIFMDNFETNLLASKNPIVNHVKFWYRYVDDIVCLFTGTNRHLELFLKHLNSIHPSIQFTMEVETNKALNFLDLTLTREEHHISFSIFHKPTQSDTIIPADSHHPVSHKHAAFHSMIHRLIHTPMSVQNYTKELNIIKQIALNNGYHPSIIENILSKKLHQKALAMVYPPPPKDDSSYFRMIFSGEKTLEVAKIVTTATERKPAFYSSPTVGLLLTNNRTKIDVLQKSGVYKLKCGTCNDFYIGQTGRSFKIRFTEHNREINKAEIKSSFAEHLTTEKHSCDFSRDFEILHFCNKGRKLDLLENIEIKTSVKRGEPILNDILNPAYSPLVEILT